MGNVAGAVEISRFHVCELICLKRIPSARVRRSVRVHEEELREWIGTHGSPLPDHDKEEPALGAPNPRAIELSRR